MRWGYKMRFEQDRFTVVYRDTADYMTDGEGGTATFPTIHDAELAGIDSGREYDVVNMFDND